MADSDKESDFTVELSDNDDTLDDDHSFAGSDGGNANAPVKKVTCKSNSWSETLLECVCVCLTSSREGLPSDAIPIAGRIHPPQCLRRHTPSRLGTSASPWGDVS